MKQPAQLATTALLATLILTVVTTNSATAAGWHINGTELAKGAKQALTTASIVDTDSTLNVVSKSETITVVCKGPNIDATSPEIIGTNEGMAKALTFTGCATTKPATKCQLSSSEIQTNPVKVFITKGAGEADVETVTPLSEEPFAEVPFSEKDTCAFSEAEPVNGAVRLKLPTGQTEEELQAVEGLGTVENNSLEVAKDKMYVEGGKVLLEQATSSKWSFR